MQLLMGYSATAAGLAISPAGLVTMVEIPLVGWALSRGFDARRMIFAGIFTVALGTWWLSLGNLDMGEASLIWPRVVQVMGIGMTTVPPQHHHVPFPPHRPEQQRRRHLRARPQRRRQHRHRRLQHLPRARRPNPPGLHRRPHDRLQPPSPCALPKASPPPTAPSPPAGQPPINAYAGLSLLYAQVQRQASLLAYMDQYRLFTYLLLALLPLVFLLKTP